MTAPLRKFSGTVTQCITNRRTRALEKKNLGYLDIWLFARAKVQRRLAVLVR